MGKSYKKTPIHGITTAETEKWWKQQASRQRRRLESNIMASLPDETPDIEDPTRGAYGPKDGKAYDPAHKVRK